MTGQPFRLRIFGGLFGGHGTFGQAWPWPVFVALAILCGATYLGLDTGLRYTQAKAEQGPDSAPPADLRDWPRSRAGLDFTFEDGVASASLAPAVDGEVAALQARLVPGVGTDALRITLDAGGRGLEDGAETWQRARVQLLSFDAGGRFLWYWPKTVATISGDRPFGSISAIVPMTAEVNFARLVIYNGARSGELRVGPPRVEALAERPAFAALRWVLALAWLAYGAWVAHALSRRAAGPVRAGLLLGVGLIALFGALTPQPAFRNLSAPVQAAALSLADAIFAPGPGPALQPPPEVASEEATRPLPEGPAHQLVQAPVAPETDYPFSFKQLSHFAVFFLLAVAAVAAFPRTPRSALLACLGAFAIATEVLQSFVVTRNGSLADLAIDAAGLALAALAVAAADRITASARARRRARAGPGASP